MFISWLLVLVRERKLKDDTLCLEKHQGGIGLVKVKDQQICFLIKNLIKIKKKGIESQHFKMVDDFFTPIGGLEYFLKCCIRKREFIGLNKVKSHFWRSAIEAWLVFTHTNFFTENRIEEDSIPLFNNKLIRFRNESLFFNDWIQNDVKYVHDIVTNGKFITYEELKTKIPERGNLLFDFFAIKNAIMRSEIYRNISQQRSNNQIERLTIDLSKTKNHYIRGSLIQNRAQTPICIETWQKKLGVDITKYFTIGLRATKEISLRYLHYRILHHIFPTNKILEKMQVKSSPFCDNCEEIETIEHMFFLCKELRNFWKHVSDNISIILGRAFILDVVSAIFGLDHSEIDASDKQINVANHVLLIAKLCVSKKKIQREERGLLFSFEYEKVLREKYLAI